jgi:hypothetical protein
MVFLHYCSERRKKHLHAVSNCGRVTNFFKTWWLEIMTTYALLTTIQIGQGSLGTDCYSIWGDLKAGI